MNVNIIKHLTGKNENKYWKQVFRGDINQGESAPDRQGGER